MNKQFIGIGIAVAGALLVIGAQIYSMGKFDGRQETAAELAVNPIEYKLDAILDACRNRKQSEVTVTAKDIINAAKGKQLEFTVEK